MLITGPSDPSESLCHPFVFKPDMDSSHTVNVPSLGLTRYPNIMRLLAQITSSAEKRTAMVERITMFLSTFAESTELETVANSMLRVSIQISYLHSEILLAVGTMQRRMMTFAAGDYEDRNLLRVIRAADRTLDGTNSDLQRLVTIFSELQASISLVTLSSPSTPSVHTQTGSIEWTDRLISTIQNSISILENWEHFGNGMGDTYPIISSVS